jgi:hypothetical protein
MRFNPEDGGRKFFRNSAVCLLFSSLTTENTITQKHCHGDYKFYKIERNFMRLDYELTWSGDFKCDILS